MIKFVSSVSIVLLLIACGEGSSDKSAKSIANNNNGVKVDLNMAREYGQQRANLPILESKNGTAFYLAYNKNPVTGGGSFADQYSNGTRNIVLITDDGTNRSVSMVQLNCIDKTYQFGMSVKPDEWKQVENQVSGIGAAVTWGCAVPVSQ